MATYSLGDSICLQPTAGSGGHYFIYKVEKTDYTKMNLYYLCQFSKKDKHFNYSIMGCKSSHIKTVVKTILIEKGKMFNWP